MKGLITTILAVLFTGVTLVAVLLIILVKFDYNSALGKDLRLQALHFPAFVQIFNLNQPGDNRLAYLSDKYPDFSVSIHYLQDALPEEEVTTWVTYMIRDTTGKVPTVGAPRIMAYPTQTSYTDRDLNQIRKTLSIPFTSPAQLKIVYLSAYTPKPDYLGIILHRDTIFIFKDQLRNLQEKPDIMKRLEHSTLMHEWGHLLGLAHVPFSGCIMSEDVEVYDNRWLKDIEVPLTHCQDTLYDLGVMKEQYR